MTTVASTPSVPAGKYYITGTAELSAGISGGGTVGCELVDANNTSPEADIAVAASARDPYTLSFTDTTTSAGVISLQCATGSPGFSFVSSSSTVTAIAVGAIN